MNRRNFYIGILIFIIVFSLLFQMTFILEPYEQINKQYDCIISILVHEKIDFLLKQLENIKAHVECNYAIILNCNDHMFEECSKIQMPDNVYICDAPFNKKYLSGDLFRGVYNNMVYALDRFVFDFFITLSSRNMFSNKMSLSDLQNLEPHVEDPRPWSEKRHSWRWPEFSKSSIVIHYLSKNQEVSSCAHEGAVFTQNGCKHIMQFLENNPDIKQDSFEFNGTMEEFVMTTISVNSGEPVYYIGNGCCNEDGIMPNNPNVKNKKFVFKIKRDDVSINNMNNIAKQNHDRSLVW
jgi:hypothetical protein